MRREKEKKLEKKLSVVRRASYTFLAFVVFEFSGVFALAGLKGLYVVTETKSNAFYPKTYVDVGIQEPNGNGYTLNSNNVAVNSKGNGKQVYVENLGKNSKKPVIVRAKIVAEVYDESGGVYQESLDASDYKISVNNVSDYTSTDSNLWYYDGEYYYYTSILEVNSNTTELFDNVEFTDIGLAKIPEGCYVKFHVIIDCLDADAVIGSYWSSAPDIVKNLGKSVS